MMATLRYAPRWLQVWNSDLEMKVSGPTVPRVLVTRVLVTFGWAEASSPCSRTFRDFAFVLLHEVLQVRLVVPFGIATPPVCELIWCQ